MKILDLCDRYQVQRSTLNNRLAALRAQGWQPSKDADGRIAATAAEVEILDSLAAHLADGGRLKDFILPTTTRAIAPAPLETVQQRPDSGPDTLQVLTQALAQWDPTRQDRALAWYAREGLAIASSKARELLGVKPRGQRFQRGSWLLIRAGKIGREAGWLVARAELSQAFAESLEKDRSVLNGQAIAEGE